MRLYIFKLLDKIKQVEIAWNSIWLANREDGRFNYELYQIDGFYAELKYKKGERLVSELKTFINPDQLEPYFWQIDLSKLLPKNLIKRKRKRKDNFFRLIYKRLN